MNFVDIYMPGTKTILSVCRSWGESDVKLLMRTLKEARTDGFRSSSPNEVHKRLNIYMEPLGQLFERYGTPTDDREALKDAVIAEIQSGYRRELVDSTKPRSFEA